MPMNTQTKALLLVALLCAAHAERDERKFSANQKLQKLHQHVLQAQSDNRPGSALNEEVAKIGENMSHSSRACAMRNALNNHVTKATGLLGKKGKDFNSLNLVNLVKELTGITATIALSKCSLSDLDNGKWKALKVVLNILAPNGVAGKQLNEGDLGNNMNEVVANTFSLAIFGKLWKDQTDAPMPELDLSAPADTYEEVEAETVQTEEDIKKWYEVKKTVSLLESGSNTSQLVSSKWNPFSFVGGIVIGAVALVIGIICVLLNIVNAVVMSVLNGILGSIYCLIKAVVKSSNPESAEGFIPCMKNNFIAYVFKVVWRCQATCAFWSLKFAGDMIFQVALGMEEERGGLTDPVAPQCIEQ